MESLQINSIKFADPGKSYVALVSFAFKHDGLPLDVIEEYKSGDDWRRTTIAQFVGAGPVVIRHARVLESRDGELWLTHGVQLPGTVKDAVVRAVTAERERRGA